MSCKYNNINSFFVELLLIQSMLGLIVIPFRNNIFLSSKDNEQNEQFWRKFYDKEIFTEIEVGNPPQTVNFNIVPDDYVFLIANNICYEKSPSFYNYSQSLSFKKSYDYSYQYKGTTEGMFSYEMFNFYNSIDLKSNVTINELYFYLGLKNRIAKKESNYCGVIGLSWRDLSINNDEDYNDGFLLSSFLSNLKSHKLVEKYLWTYEYFDSDNDNKQFFNLKNINKEHIINNYNGFIIFGQYPHEYNSEEYDEEGLNSILVSNYFDNLNWGIDWDKIYYSFAPNNKISLNYLKSILLVNINYIIAPKEFFDNIQNDYFNFYINKNICSIKTESSNYGDYEIFFCKKKYFTLNEIEKFPSIYFYNSRFNYTFNLTYEELFEEFNDKILFLIIKEKYNSDFWKFGKLFLKKYHFTFSQYSKTINIYTNKRIYPNKSNLFKKSTGKLNEKYRINNIWLIVALFSLIIGIFIGYKIYYKKIYKKKANELKDEFDYSSQNNKNNLFGDNQIENDSKLCNF